MASQGIDATSHVKLSPEFHRDRLRDLCERCPEGLILFRGELDWFRKRELRAFDPAYRDTDFKQERNLYYVTGLEIPDSFVLIDPRKERFSVYSDWQNSRELQNARVLGIDKVHPTAAFLRDVRICGEGYENIYVLYAPVLEDGPMFTKTSALVGLFPPGMGEPATEEMQFARRIAEIFPSHRVKSVAPALNDMRQIKQPEEIRLLRAANQVAVKAVMEALRSIRSGIHNHDIAAVVEYTLRREGAVGPTFSVNLMSGPHQFTKLGLLWADYQHLDRELEPGDGIFLDIGADVGYYVSDIGRTAPVSGRFSPEQQKLYDIYLSCYLEALKAVRPGITQRTLVEKCVQKMEAQLPTMQEDWLRKAAADFIAMTRVRPALGHYIDMDVVGKGPAPDEPLKPGMVFAIEPLLFCEDKGFGVFVEDNILVTEEAYEVLSTGLPYAGTEIESVMRQPGIIETVDLRELERCGAMV